MDIYHSFWDFGWNSLSREVYNMHKLSALLALKNYGNIHLITIEKGKDFLSGIPYTTVELYEETLPVELKDVWSLSKIYAYQQISKKKNPFFHIDYDVFLFKRLPEKFEKSKVLVQHMEIGNQVIEYYHLNKFFNNCKNLYLSNDKVKFAYNMGIFGGTDIDAIDFYAKESLKLLLDQDNIDSYWKNSSINIPHVSRSVVLEQWYLACCLDHLGIEKTLLIEEEQDLDETSIELGYCHVWGAKYDSKIHKKILNKIYEYEEII